MLLNNIKPDLKYSFSVDCLKGIFDDRISKNKFRGVDGTTVKTFENNLTSEIELISQRIISGTYTFSRYKEKLILKGANSIPRQISIPTVRDALALRALCEYLVTIFPKSTLKPPHEYIKNIVTIVEQEGANLNFIRLDIKNFYPSIDHNVLLDKLKRGGLDEAAIMLVKAAIKTPTGLNGDDHGNPLGVPQGLSISNILASIYFQDFDEKWLSKYKYFRYVDDIMILESSDIAKAILDEITEDLKKSLKLDAHELSVGGSGKTTIQTVSQGVDYLGFTISDRPLKVRERSYRKVFEAIIKICTRHKYNPSDALFFWKLNLRITGCTFSERSVGWAFYFRQMNDISQLHRLDVFVRKVLKRYGRQELVGSVKSFVKTHREIRYNRRETKYIPDFDIYELEDMIKIISLLTGEKEEEIKREKEEIIEKKFRSLIKKQTEQLEQETIDFTMS